MRELWQNAQIPTRTNTLLFRRSSAPNSNVSAVCSGIRTFQFAAASNQTDTAALVKLAGDAGNAYAARNLATLKKITADDYVQIDVRGRSLNRTQWLDFVENRKSELTVESDDIRVRYYGQAAVVTGHWTYTKKDGDKEVVWPIN